MLRKSIDTFTGRIGEDFYLFRLRFKKVVGQGAYISAVAADLLEQFEYLFAYILLRAFGDDVKLIDAADQGDSISYYLLEFPRLLVAADAGGGKCFGGIASVCDYHFFNAQSAAAGVIGDFEA